MAKMTLKGFEEYLAKIQEIYGSSEKMAKHALYKGAGIVADRMKAGLNSLPTHDPAKYYRDEMPPGLSPDEKAAVISHFGVSKFRVTGSVISTKIGFDGSYTNAEGKRRSIQTLVGYAENGTSWSKKTPVIRQAINASRAAATAAMIKQYEEDLKKISG